MRRTRSSRFVPQGLMGRYLRKSRGGGSGELKTPCWYKIGSKHVYFFPSEPPGCKHHQRPCPQGGKNSVDVTGLILPVGTYPQEANVTRMALRPGEITDPEAGI